MKQITTILAPSLVMFPVALIALAGCAVQAPDGPEEDGVAVQAFGPTCTQTSPGDGADATWTETGAVSFAATGYGNFCYKSGVVDVTNLQVGTNNGAGVFTSWIGTIPTSDETCIESYVTVDLFNWNGSAWVYNTATPYKTIGWWDGEECHEDGVLFPISTGSVINGDNFRFEVTARESDGSLAPVLVSTVVGF